MLIRWASFRLATTDSGNMATGLRSCMQRGRKSFVARKFKKIFLGRENILLSRENISRDKPF